MVLWVVRTVMVHGKIEEPLDNVQESEQEKCLP